MDNFRQKASEAAVLLRSRSFLVTMLAAITGFLTLWITLSADAVYIRDNGQLQLVYTTRNTADAILSERGIVTMAYDDVDFSGFDLRGAIPEIEITRAFDVTLTTDEGSMVVKTTGGTVGEVLNANGIEYDENDMISYPPGMYVQPGEHTSELGHLSLQLVGALHQAVVGGHFGFQLLDAVGGQAVGDQNAPKGARQSTGQTHGRHSQAGQVHVPSPSWMSWTLPRSVQYWGMSLGE